MPFNEQCLIEYTSDGVHINGTISSGLVSGNDPPFDVIRLEFRKLSESGESDHFIYDFSFDEAIAIASALLTSATKYSLDRIDQLRSLEKP